MSKLPRLRGEQEAVAVGLSRFRLGAAALRALGFDEAWAAGLRHWRGRLVEQHLACVAIEAEDAAAAEARRALVDDARRLWGRLTLAARLAGLRGLALRGGAPSGG